MRSTTPTTPTSTTTRTSTATSPTTSSTAATTTTLTSTTTTTTPTSTTTTPTSTTTTPTTTTTPVTTTKVPTTTTTAAATTTTAGPTTTTSASTTTLPAACQEIEVTSGTDEPFTLSQDITIEAKIPEGCPFTQEMSHQIIITNAEGKEVNLAGVEKSEGGLGFQIPRGYLGVGNFTCTLTIPDYGVETVVLFKVKNTPLKAKIKGPKVSADLASLVFDASESKDPDKTEGQVIEYSWHSKAAMGEDSYCQGVAHGAQYAVSCTAPPVETKCIIKVIITKGDRQTTEEMEFTCPGDGQPTVALSMLSDNPGGCVRIHLEIKLEVVCSPTALCTATPEWNLFDISGNRLNVMPAITSKNGPTSLFEISKNTLEGNHWYELTVTIGGTVATLAFATCTVPKQGICTCNEAQGIAVQTRFSFTCDKWLDDDFPGVEQTPLCYSCWYHIEGANMDHILLHEACARGPYQTDMFLLPEGLKETGYLVVITCYIGATRGGQTSFTKAIKVLPNANVNMTLLNADSQSNNPIVVQRTCVLVTMYSTMVDDALADKMLESTKNIERPNAATGAATVMKMMGRKSTPKMKDKILESMASFSATADSIMSKYEANSYSDRKQLLSGCITCLRDVWIGENSCSQADAESGDSLCASRGGMAVAAANNIQTTLVNCLAPNEQREIGDDKMSMMGAILSSDAPSSPIILNSGGKIEVPDFGENLDIKVMATANNTMGGNPDLQGTISLKVSAKNGEINSASEDKPFVVKIPIKSPAAPGNITCHGSRLFTFTDSMQTLLLIADNDCNMTVTIGDQSFLSETYIPEESSDYKDQFQSEVWNRLSINLADFEEELMTFGNITVNVSFQGGLKPNEDSRYGEAMFASNSIKCVYWNETKAIWDTEGVKVLPRDCTMELMACSATHLTMFSSSFIVPPNTIDFSTVFDNLDQKLLENIHVVITVLGVIVLYVVLAVYLRRKDKADRIKWSIAPLMDNLPGDTFHYNMTIHTASKNGAATRSNVFFVLAGEQGETEVRKLQAAIKKSLTRASVHRYILSVPRSLGNLIYIRIWHDNSGKGDNASWFLDRIVIKDTSTSEKYVFLCNRWLAVDRDDGQIERLLPVATLDDLKAFQFLFRTTARKDLTDGHLWFSLMSRPTYSKFTRVQRLSCCLALLYSTMIANAMWYKAGDNVEGVQVVRIGPLEFTPQQVFISIASSVVSIPVSVLIVFLFRRSRTRPLEMPKAEQQKPEDSSVKYGPTKTTETREDHDALAESEPVGEDNDDVLSDSKSTQEFAAHINLSRLTVDETPCDESEHETSSQAINDGTELSRTEGAECDEVTNESNDNEKENRPENDIEAPAVEPGHIHGTKKAKTKVRSGVSLPWWCIYIAWFFVVLTVAVSTFFTILYSFEWGREKSTGWLIAFILSFFQSIIIIQPLKVLALAMVVALIFKQPPDDEDDFTEQDFISKMRDNHTTVEPQNVECVAAHRVPYQKKEIDDSHLENMRKAREKELRMFAILKEIVVYVIYLVIVCVIIYDSRDPNSYGTKHELSNVFNVAKFKAISNKALWFTWLDQFLVPNVYAEQWYNNDQVNSRLVHFLSDLQYFRLGPPRLRLARVKTDDCPTLLQQPLGSHRECYPEYSLTSFDHHDYTIGWEPMIDSPTGSINSSYPADTSSSPWIYRSTRELGGAPFIGRLTAYGGGGYVADLGPDQQSARNEIKHLHESTWLDRAARAVFVEFNVVNPSTKLFSTLKFVAEMPATGGLIPHVTIKTIQLYAYVGAKALYLIILQLIFVAFTIYHIVSFAKKAKAGGKAHFKSKWNLLDLADIITACLSCFMYGVRFIVVRTTINKFHSNKEAFLDFTYVVFYDEIYSYVLAFLVFLSMLKLLRLIRFNQKVAELMSTLEATIKPLMNFLVFFSVIYFSFGQFGYLVFGRKLKDYSTFITALESLFSIMLMDFNFDDLQNANSILGPLYFFLFIVVVGFVVMNMFLAILNEVYSAMQASKLTTASDAEMVEYILDQFKGMLGFIQIPNDIDDDDDTGKPGVQRMNKTQCKEFLKTLESQEPNGKAEKY